MRPLAAIVLLLALAAPTAAQTPVSYLVPPSAPGPAATDARHAAAPGVSLGVGLVSRGAGGPAAGPVAEPTPARAERPLWKRLLYRGSQAYNVAGNCYDAWTTRRAEEVGLMEGNLILRDRDGKFVPYRKAILTAATIAGGEVLWYRGHDWKAIAANLFSGTVGVVAGAHNDKLTREEIERQARLLVPGAIVRPNRARVRFAVRF